MHATQAIAFGWKPGFTTVTKVYTSIELCQQNRIMLTQRTAHTADRLIVLNVYVYTILQDTTQLLTLHHTAKPVALWHCPAPDFAGGGPGTTLRMDHLYLFIGAVDHKKDQRTGLINTTFILVGAPTVGGPGPWLP